MGEEFPQQLGRHIEQVRYPLWMIRHRVASSTSQVRTEKRVKACSRTAANRIKIPYNSIPRKSRCVSGGYGGWLLAGQANACSHFSSRNVRRPDSLERHPCSIGLNTMLPRNGISQPKQIAAPDEIDNNSDCDTNKE